MLNKLKKSNTKGFTIIEVMIVLAIAGLIILIVFLAVPALQRNGRNTAIKADAGNVSGAVNEFKSNNDSGAPTTIGIASGVITVSGAAGTTQASGKSGPNTTISATATPTAVTLGYVLGGACPADTANPRSVAIYYPVESSGGLAIKCIAS